MEDKAVGLVFSKDRAMQMDAVLQSLYLHCRDIDQLQLKVLYTVSNARYGLQYRQLAAHYPAVTFIREEHFKEQLLTGIFGYDVVLFVVDDALFVRNFSMTDICEALQIHTDAIGFSLRLGKNTCFCYPLQREQPCPAFTAIENGYLKFLWTKGAYDFGYPLEVSSSVYRVADLWQILQCAHYSNPNTLEMLLAGNRELFSQARSMLLCSTQSLAFCNPVNIVQSTCDNLSGIRLQYPVDRLAQLFAAGYRVDVERYSGLIPAACHQEVALQFTNHWKLPEEEQA